MEIMLRLMSTIFVYRDKKYSTGNSPTPSREDEDPTTHMGPKPSYLTVEKRPFVEPLYTVLQSLKFLKPDS